MPALEVKLVVKGIVQGVGYRGHCRQIARKFGVTGYADNLPDGTVEVFAVGPEQAVQEFIAELRKTKPQDARIDEVLELHRKKPDFVPGSFRVI